MKRITILLIPAIMLGVCSCKKSADSGFASTVDSIVLSYPGLHKSESQAFQFNEARLVQFIRTIYDSTGYLGAFQKEVQVHHFVYSGNGNSPASVAITDTNYTSPGVEYYEYPLGYIFSYGILGRLAKDTGIINSAQYGMSFSYSHDTTYKGQNGTNFYPQDLVAATGGNLFSLWRGEVKVGDIRNPLYDGDIARTYGPFFLTDPPEFLTPPSYFSFPIDFVSQHLQTSYNDVVEGAQLSFSWSTDASGKVMSGVMTGLPSGSASIRFSYRP